jgi:hypothetical protein
MRWVGHVALMGEIRNVYAIWVEKLEERNYSYSSAQLSTAP